MFAKAMKSALFIGLIPAAALFAADSTVKTTYRMSGTAERMLTQSMLGRQPAPEMTIYVHDGAQRVESVGYASDFAGPRTQPPPHTAVIVRCDKGMVYQLDLNRKEYAESKLDKFPTEKQFARRTAHEQEDMQIDTVDTGETRDFNGRVAKHLLTTIKGKGYEASLDGWYLNTPAPGCAPAYMRQRHVQMRAVSAQLITYGGGAAATVETPSTFVYNWVLPGGLAVQETSTQRETFDIQGRMRANEMLTEQKIVEFSEAPVDPSLFEVPSGFKKLSPEQLGRRKER